MTGITYCGAIVETVNEDDRLRLSHHEKHAVTFTMYALLCIENGNYEAAALYLAKAEIERRAT